MVQNLLHFSSARSHLLLRGLLFLAHIQTSIEQVLQVLLLLLALLRLDWSSSGGRFLKNRERHSFERLHVRTDVGTDADQTKR